MPNGIAGTVAPMRVRVTAGAAAAPATTKSSTKPSQVHALFCNEGIVRPKVRGGSTG
jgi:hypothetical protein